MNRSFLTVTALTCLASFAFAQDAPVAVETSLGQKGGWMPDGWGSFKMALTNKSAAPIKVLHWNVQWQVKGKPNGDPWGGDLKETIEPGKTWTKEEISSLPLHVYHEAKPDAPQLVGTYTVRLNDRELSVPFRVAVPGATLPEPLKTVYGKTVGLAQPGGESQFSRCTPLERVQGQSDSTLSAVAISAHG